MKWIGLAGLLMCVAFAVGASERERWNSLFKAEEYEELLAEVRPKAEDGNAYAQMVLSILYGKGLGVEQDRETSFEWLKRSAQNGDVSSQSLVAQNYLSGKYVEKDPEKGIKWLKQAAANGHAESQMKLATHYLMGQYVRKDLDRSLELQREAAEGGSTMARLLIAKMHLRGSEVFDVQKDLAEATRWALRLHRNPDFELDGELLDLMESPNEHFPVRVIKVETANVRSGPGPDNEVVAQLHRDDFGWVLSREGDWLEIMPPSNPRGWVHASLLEPEGMELFGVSLRNAPRPLMRQAIKNAGAKPIREKYSYWYDKYDASGLLEGADELVVGYTQGDADHFAVLRYEFSSRMDREKVIEIKKMVSSKYGPPDEQTGKERIGELTYIWREDGVVIRASRSWPSTTSYLTYRLPDRFETMTAQIEASEAQAEQEKRQKEWQKQADNF